MLTVHGLLSLNLAHFRLSDNTANQWHNVYIVQCTYSGKHSFVLSKSVIVLYLKQNGDVSGITDKRWKKANILTRIH